MKLFCTAERSKQLHDPHREPTNLSKRGKEAWKKIQGFNRIRRRDLREYRCDAVPTELWTHKNNLAPNVWLHSSVGRTSHRYSRRSRVRITLKPWFFSGLTVRIVHLLSTYCLMDQYNHYLSFVASIMVSYKFPIIIKQFKVFSPIQELP